MKKPPVRANTMSDESRRVPIPTPTSPPRTAVRDAMKFMKRAILIDTPELSKTAKSPKDECLY